MALHTTIVATMIPKNWKAEENKRVNSTRNLNKTEKVPLKTGHCSVVVVAISHLISSAKQHIVNCHAITLTFPITVSHRDAYCTYIPHHSRVWSQIGQGEAHGIA